MENGKKLNKMLSPTRRQIWNFKVLKMVCINFGS